MLCNGYIMLLLAQYETGSATTAQMKANDNSRETNCGFYASW